VHEEKQDIIESMNRTKATIDILGRLARDAEISYTQEGLPILSFTLVTEDSKKTLEEWETIPSFWDIQLLGKYGERIQPHMKKGRYVSCTGKARIDHWVYEGKDYTKVKVVALHIAVLPDMQHHEVGQEDEEEGKEL
jgi:single-strand DNA-binding protein